MPILNFPSIRADSENWGIQFNTRVFTSPYTNASQTAELAGAKWGANLTYTRREGREARALQGFLVACRGRAGRFYLTPADSAPLGTVLGAGVVNGAGQTGNSLSTDGWDVSQALVLASGDYFEINGELKKVTADVSSNEAGQAVIPFEPALRTSAPDSGPIITTNPKAIMRLSTDLQANWDSTAPIIYAMSFACEEALDG